MPPSIAVSALALAWRWTGAEDPTRPAVVLIHGLGSSSRDWPLQLPALVPRFRVLLVDLPGHGESPMPEGRLTIQGMAEDVARAMKHAGADAAHLVGVSLGACVGLTLAIRAPERVRSLTLVSAFARLAPAGAHSALHMLVRLALLGVAPMRVVAAHVARAMFPAPDQRALYDAAVASLARTPRRAYWRAIGALRRFDVRADLARVRCPALIVHGERDRAVALASARELTHAIPDARLLVLAGRGHAGHCEDPTRFNDALLAFLERA